MSMAGMAAEYQFADDFVTDAADLDGGAARRASCPALGADRVIEDTPWAAAAAGLLRESIDGHQSVSG